MDAMTDATPSRSNTSGSSNFDPTTDSLLLRHTGSGFTQWTPPEIDSPARDIDDAATAARLTRVDHPRSSFSLITAGQDPINCDIIFVHGLSGDDKSTWKCGSVSWPDMLAQEFKHSRLLSFNYDRSIWTGSNMRAMQSVAEQFLLKLTMHRRRDAVGHRPIIFVAHSLGGWLVKAAVALAKGYASLVDLGPTYGDINESTRGIVFFGTPHRTRTVLGWHSVVNRIRAASTYIGNSTEEDVRDTTLEEDRPKPTFMRLLSSFESSLDDGHSTIYSCYENHETGTDRLATLVSPSFWLLT
ncbi:hypothetical protein B0T17DRAFT_384102 [Bombardia bombarda]|uniref:AB hydrolase-1 domain-containing protein n=1 Tax=Bombardia bombarda TaxID=252184 RepID=A0AA39TII7_9PEZI|nr:hypothetical protein B0T17DRAFT_384102 [Bombardia bombarda]